MGDNNIATTEQAIAEKLDELKKLIVETAGREHDCSRVGALNLVALLLRQPLEVVDGLLAARSAG